MEDKYKDDRASLWEEVQKKTFCGWINMHLSTRNMRVNNLEEDFCDGVKLITLLEILHGKKIEGRYYKNPKSKPYKIDNVNFALNFITDNLKIKLISCSAEDIVDGNVKIILGMCWRLIQKFQLTHDNSRQTLLAWVKEITGLEVENFQSSFQDGVIFCALVHKFDPSLFPMDTIKHENKAENLNRAFNMAEEHMDIPQLLDAEDMIKGLVDERSLMTYVSLINRAFEQKNAPIIRYNANLEVKAKEAKSDDHHPAPVDDIRSQLQKENEKLLKELESMKKDYEDEKRLRLELETEQIILKNLVNKQNEEKQAKLDKIPDIESSDDEDDASDDEEKHKQKPAVAASQDVSAEKKEAVAQDDQKQPEVVEQSKELVEEKKEDEKKEEEKKEEEKKEEEKKEEEKKEEEKKEEEKKEEVQLVEEKKDENQKDDAQKDDGLRKKKKDTKRKTERRKSSRANKDSLLENLKESEKKLSANNEETQKLLATKDKRIEELEKEVSDTRNKLREQSKVSETLQKSLEDTREEIGLIQKRHKKAQDKDTKRIQKRLEKRLQRREKELETLKLNYETELKKKDDEIETLKGQLKKTQAALGSSKEDLPSESDQLADVEFLKSEYQSLLPIIFNFEEEEKTLALRASKPKLDAPDEPDEDK